MMPERHVLIAVEGRSDQAFVVKALRIFLNFKLMPGEKSQWPEFWTKLIPKFPFKDDLYAPMPVPQILHRIEDKDILYIVVYAPGGTEEIKRAVPYFFENNPEYREKIAAFGIVADADHFAPDVVAKQYAASYKRFFPDFPDEAGQVQTSGIRTGCFVLPDNINQGVLETLLIPSGRVAYPKHVEKAESFVKNFDANDKKHWARYDNEKAVIAAAVSILKPGRTNTVSISDNDWISPATIAYFQGFIEFVKKLASIP
ncbi:MAG: hypothetical protein NTX50_07915 [Candidatus Sumerlaeota bacterium]|nr:hypothetical protein [Candidatus Sumerlaeota bacterium]